MMRHVCLTLVSASLAMQAGCASVNEGTMIVQGRAVDASSSVYATCLLDTRDARGAIIDRRRVSGEIREAIVVAPQEADYSFAISCAGANETYQSPAFRFDPSEPIDLGRVVLQRP